MSKMYKNSISLMNTTHLLTTINHKEETEEVVSLTGTRSQPRHFIHIIDRSGSMYGDIVQLCEEVKLTVDEMQEDDIISIIWFSSHGQCRTVVNGANKSKNIYKLIDSMKSVVGMTCFSSPMEEVNKVIADWKHITEEIVVSLFTDGEPVVPWSIKEEESKVFAELDKMKDKILAFNTIGYGYYYNQDFLRRIAATSMYGVATHSTKINEYLEIFRANYERISELTGDSVEIEVPAGVEILYLNTTSTKHSADGKIKMTRLEKRKNQFFLLSKSDFKFNYNGEEFDTATISDVAQNATINNFLYGYAFEQYYAGKRKVALNILSNSLGDKPLIDKLLNAFTMDEVAAYKKELRKAVMKPASRNAGTAPIGYLPREDALCLIDILYMLTEGSNYYVVNRNYQRIGVQVVDEYDIFTSQYDGELTSALKNMTFNKKELNVSIQWEIPGYVTLNPKQAKEHGLPKTVEARKVRNHTIVKDGNLNMQTIEAILDQKTYDQFKQLETEHNVQFMVDVDQVENGHKVNLQLNAIPVINATYANSVESIDAVYDSVETENKLALKQKVLNSLVKEAKLANSENLLEKKFAAYTPEQVEILKSHGLSSDFTYNAIDPNKKEAIDYYESRYLEFNLSGYNAGKIPDILAKAADIAGGNKRKKLNTAEQFIIDYIADLTQRMTNLNLVFGDNSTESNQFFLDERKQVQKELTSLRKKLQAMKLAKVLTGDWFEGIESDEDGNQTYLKPNGGTLVIKQARKQNPISL